MTIEELKNTTLPFDVVCTIGCSSRGTVIGFSEQDPLDVGGGMFPDMPTVYFKGGGWLLVSHLLRHYELATPTTPVTGQQITM